MDISILLLSGQGQRFVLFVDEIGQETRLQKAIEKIASQSPTIRIPELINRDPKLIFSSSTNTIGPLQLPSISEPCNVVFEPISRLLVHDETFNVAGIFRALHRLKRLSSVKQIFTVASTPNIQEPFVVKFLEHLADVIVTFLDQKHLKILTKKIGGQVTSKFYDYQLRGAEISVKETVKTEIFDKPEEPSIDPETLGTFKIGKLGAQELQAKNALQLPYEKISKESKVIYVPDADDDLDPEEEDPDDDLYV